VVKLKSFTQAATVLHVSQPTPTAQIKTLEDGLRLCLFGRPRRIERNRYRAERVLPDLDTVLLDVRDVVAEAPRRSADRGAAASVPALARFSDHCARDSGRA
jgi:DNA-binding transcriptional LysR family regulator